MFPFRYSDALPILARREQRLDCRLQLNQLVVGRTRREWEMLRGAFSPPTRLLPMNPLCERGTLSIKQTCLPAKQGLAALTPSVREPTDNWAPNEGAPESAGINSATADKARLI